MFPDAKYIWLTRRDKKRQAISLYLASQTQRWWSIDGCAVPNTPGGGEDVEFDPGAIATFQTMLEHNDRSWQEVFDSNQIKPLVINTKTSHPTTPEQSTKLLIRWASGPRACSHPRARLRRQSTARNEQWAARCPPSKQHNRPPCQPRPHKQPISRAADQALRRGTRPVEAVGSAGTPTRPHPQRDRQGAHQQRVQRQGGALGSPTGGIRPVSAGKPPTPATPEKGGCVAQRSRAATAARFPRRHHRRQARWRQQFRDRYYAANRPVIIDGLLSDFNALTSWTPDYLKRIAGQSTVEIVTGRAPTPATKSMRTGTARR